LAAEVEMIEHDGPVEVRAMQSLASRVFPVTGYRHIGDLAWAYGLYHDRSGHAALWRDGDSVVAWAWVHPGESMVQVDPGRPELADGALAWLEARASGRLGLEVGRGETAVVDALSRRGYRAARRGPFMACLERDLTGLPPVVLPDGSQCRPVRADDPVDLERRAGVHRAAFASTSLTGQRYQRLVGTWPYRSDFDLAVEAPDGELVAYCQGWYDEATGIGEFEPVGTRPQDARRGFARAACSAVLHAFAAAGGRRAVVYSRGDAAYPVPKRLYQSLGFAPYNRTDWYRQPA
jgi:ribosomal protein S18 acetylase RimI-like enzyme